MNFFSIIVPARNEENYIEKTLQSLNSLDYPKELYEIIVVESGSTDNTLRELKKLKNKLTKVYSINKKGVSVARNYGASKTSKKSEWLIFLDADTILKKDFLNQVNKAVSSKEEPVIGTMRVKPLEKSIKFNIIYFSYNLFLKFVKASYALQIIRKKEFAKVRYDENLKVGEDYIIIRKIREYGRFFFLWSDQAETSTRRFQKWGSFKLFSMWIKGSLGGYQYKKKLKYELIR